jgi:cyclopropane fatty-acyl-phospholipid synthase-like methyltransferase
LEAIEPGAAVLDIGCGSGEPIARDLIAGAIAAERLFPRSA